MEGLFACVTSCIGGKNERYAVRVHPIQRRVYFVYKSLNDFQDLWNQLRAIMKQENHNNQCDHTNPAAADQEKSFDDWLRIFVHDLSLHDLNSKFQSEQKETTSLLNSFLQLLVRRIAKVSTSCNAMPKATTSQLSQRVLALVKDFLECSQSQPQVAVQLTAIRMKKRQFGEITSTGNQEQPEDEDLPCSMPVFPIRCSSKNLQINVNKTRRLSTVDEDLEITVKSPKPVQFPLALPHVHASNGPSRRRVFAEVNFDII